MLEMSFVPSFSNRGEAYAEVIVTQILAGKRGPAKRIEEGCGVHRRTTGSLGSRKYLVQPTSLTSIHTDKTG